MDGGQGDVSGFLDEGPAMSFNRGSSNPVVDVGIAKDAELGSFAHVLPDMSASSSKGGLKADALGHAAAQTMGALADASKSASKTFASMFKGGVTVLGSGNSGGGGGASASAPRDHHAPTPAAVQSRAAAGAAHSEEAAPSFSMSAFSSPAPAAASSRPPPHPVAGQQHAAHHAAEASAPAFNLSAFTGAADAGGADGPHDGGHNVESNTSVGRKATAARGGTGGGGELKSMWKGIASATTKSMDKVKKAFDA